MAKQTKTRYKLIRAAVVSGSLLSFVPLIGAMKLGQADNSTQSVTAVQPVPGTVQSAQPTAGQAASTPSSQITSSQSTTQTRVRTRAS